MRLIEREKFRIYIFDLPDIHHHHDLNANDRRQRLYYREKSIAWKEINCFHSSYASFRSRSTNAYIDNELCRSVRLCSKEFFHRLFFLLTMNVYVCIYIYTYVCTIITFSIKPTMPSKNREEKRRERKRKWRYWTVDRAYDGVTLRYDVQ